MQNKNIFLIGHGNLAKMLLLGWAQFPELSFFIKTRTLAFPVGIKPDVVLVCVKPQDLEQALLEVNEQGWKNCVYVITAAGRSLSFCEKYLSVNSSIVRVIPNIACRVNASFTSMIKNQATTYEQMLLVHDLFKRVGSVHKFFDEDIFDVMSGINGSGIAYFAAFLKGFRNAVASSDIPADLADMCLSELLRGTSGLIEAGLTCDNLLNLVCSKGGITEAALSGDLLESTMHQMVKNAYIKTIEISKNGK